MIYLQLADLTRYIEQNKLNQIISNDATLLDGFERRGIDEMVGYLSIRYDAVKCFDPDERIPLLVDILCDIVIYHAHARIMPDMIPALRVTRYKEQVNYLEKIADGFTAPTLPVREDEPIGPLRWGNSFDKQQMDF